jgi:hypothetical protein
MTAVANIHVTNTLKKYLKNIPFSASGKNKYLFLSNSNTKGRRLLKGKGFSEVILPRINNDFRDKFLQEYIHLVESYLVTILDCLLGDRCLLNPSGRNLFIKGPLWEGGQFP